jgi:hypothetical protein
MTELDRAARRRLIWLLLTRGDLSHETLRSDGQPALRAAARPGGTARGRGADGQAGA